MDIKELQHFKKNAEANIRARLLAILEGFNNKTGLTVKRINIDIVDITGISDTKREYALGGVNIELDIFD